MRLSLFLLASTLVWAQATDPYRLLQEKQYDAAISYFLKSIEAAPDRAALHKDLGYTYLKVGGTEEARDQFAEAMRLDPADFHAALEYAFLCHDTKMTAEARRVFDRVRKTGDPESRVTAEQAFQNIDRPLAAGIERWKKALELAPESFTAHYELGGLAEQRDELELAAQHYRRAWELLPSRKQSLLDLGRVWKALNRMDDANAALLAASRAGEPRAREAALSLLPDRYPYVYEFRRAIEIDPANIDLRRELAFLLLAMQAQPEAEREFLALLARAPDDLLSCAQLGFLYLIRDEKARAMPLLERVLKGSDTSLANRVRAALKMPLLDAAGSDAVSDDPKVMAERSLKSGYLRDALEFLQSAHASDPDDGWVMLKLGWTYNILHADKLAMRWFGLARSSADPAISAEAGKAYKNLRPSLARVRATVWLYPFFSTRWHDTFVYGQAKAELRLGDLPFRPYVSLRLFGDAGRSSGGLRPEYLSESSAVVAAGIASNYWRGLMVWGEAGSAISYLDRAPAIRRVTPDYRAGASYGHSFGRLIGSETAGWFFEHNADAIYVSRYENDVLFYLQSRAGLTPPPLGSFQTQILWHGNFLKDAKGVDWANFVETGPGIRFRWAWMPRSLVFSVSALRGSYSVTQSYRSQNFFDVRAGFWYAITH